jgi:hypothetical protein
MKRVLTTGSAMLANLKGAARLLPRFDMSCDQLKVTPHKSLSSIVFFSFPHQKVNRASHDHRSTSYHCDVLP